MKVRLAEISGGGARLEARGLRRPSLIPLNLPGNKRVMNISENKAVARGCRSYQGGSGSSQKRGR